MSNSLNLATMVSEGGPLAGGSTLQVTDPISTNGASTFEITDIPSWVTKITLVFDGVSTTAANNFVYIEVGRASGYSGVNYTSTAYTISSNNVSNATSSIGFLLCSQTLTGDSMSGSVDLIAMEQSSSIYSYVVSGVLKLTGSAMSHFGGSHLDYGSGKITKLRIAMRNGSGTLVNGFDAGKIMAIYQ